MGQNRIVVARIARRLTTATILFARKERSDKPNCLRRTSSRLDIMKQYSCPEESFGGKLTAQLLGLGAARIVPRHLNGPGRSEKWLARTVGHYAREARCHRLLEQLHRREQ